MQDILDNAKRVASSAVERAAWEADKLRRVSARQHELELAGRERAALLDQLATLILDLDRSGQLTHDGLKRVAARLRDLDTELGQGQSDLRAIRDEVFTPGTVSIQVNRKSQIPANLCPSCGRHIRRGATFCSKCGAKLT